MLLRSGRYWLHIQAFQEFVRRIFGSFRTPPFLEVSNFQSPKKISFSNMIYLKLFGGYIELMSVSWCLQRWMRLVSGVIDTSTKSENHENDGSSCFLNWILKVASPKWSRIVLQSFWVILVIVFVVKMAAPDPPRPQIGNVDNLEKGGGHTNTESILWRRVGSNKKTIGFQDVEKGSTS